MATFSAVNVTFGAGSKRPATPEHAAITSHPSTGFSGILSKNPDGDESSPNTPTKHSFGGVLGQKPLPDEFTTPAKREDEPNERDMSSRLNGVKGTGRLETDTDLLDVDMGDGEDDGNASDIDGSGNESSTSDTQRPSKKKKGQRFFCTDFPPCTLSFTRSEHLARHIRKHTGERPFQCHCSRRFSRLDNLRQHAQTVHVNEEIPGDSLAAQSTRFQRQIRTDRVRTPGNRSRASTIGSQGGHSRGHSRNLSTSSIGSTASSISMTDDSRRRPQPLAMANDGSSRARLTLDPYGNIGASPGAQYAYYNPSSSGYSTPTSQTFPNGSPQFQPALISPSSTLSRSSFYSGNRAHARRLSVPSTQNPYHNHNGTYPPPFFSPMPPGSPAAFSPTNQVFASPTSSVFSHSRRDSETEMDLRRRTWHPSSNPLYAQRPATSGLTYHQTPDEPRPAFSSQPAASQMTRLPGIESFDHAPPPASRQQSSPMMMDATPRPPSSGRPSENGVSQTPARLDIAAANGVSDGQWQVQPQPSSTYQNQSTHVHPQHASMPEQPVTPRRVKRNGWYGGPVASLPVTQSNHAAVRTSPEDSGSSDGISTPAASHSTEVNPVIVNHHSNMQEMYPPAILDEQKNYYNGNEHPRKAVPTRSDSGFHGVPYNPSSQQLTPTQQTYALQAGHDPRLAHSEYHQPANHDMAKLEALVAVATSQNRAVEH